MSRRRAPLAVFTTIAVTAATLTASTSPGSAATITFTSAADTYVDNSATGTNYGTSGQLGVDNSPTKRLFLKFTVSGLGDPSAARSCASTPTTSPGRKARTAARSGR